MMNNKKEWLFVLIVILFYGRGGRKNSVVTLDSSGLR